MQKNKKSYKCLGRRHQQTDQAGYIPDSGNYFVKLEFY